MLAMPRRCFVTQVLLALALLAGSAACGGGGGSAQADIVLAPESVLPDFVRSAPPRVREAYRFAVANREVLRAFPCYCGCGAVGHTSNADCYVKAVRADGSVEFDAHALG